MSTVSSQQWQSLAHIDQLLDEGMVAPRVQTIGFFDLCDSTASKLSDGHESGTRAALRFLTMASGIVIQQGGRVVRELGDGILCLFDDPVVGCRAAVAVQLAADRLDMRASCGLTMGRITGYQSPAGFHDVHGDAVDRCSRVQDLAYPGQILIDGSLYDVVRTHLRDLTDTRVGGRFRVEVKGIGQIDLWEIHPSDLDRIDRISTPFVIHAGGRLSIHEKVDFMRHARDEIIEIGTGLTSFAKYFTGQKPAEFRDHMRGFFRKGVHLRCYALDPTYQPGVLHLREQGDEAYAEEMQRAKTMILAERRACSRAGLPGKLEYHHYRRVPEFHCLGVDVDDPINGRMLFSPYLSGMSRAECPVHQVSRISNPELYDKYLRAIGIIRENSSLIAS